MPAATGKARCHVFQQLLCGWYLYMLVLSVLTALSAGMRTRLGALAGVGVLASALLLVTVFRPLPWGNVEQVTLTAKLVVLAVALLVLLAARREDTRLIALLLAGTSLLPVVLHFVQLGATR